MKKVVGEMSMSLISELHFCFATHIKYLINLWQISSYKSVSLVAAIILEVLIPV